MAEEKRGRQTPTRSVVLPYPETKGQEAVDLYNTTGRSAQDWQALLLCWCAGWYRVDVKNKPLDSGIQKPYNVGRQGVVWQRSPRLNQFDEPPAEPPADGSPYCGYFFLCALSAVNSTSSTVRTIIMIS